jgi:uncharacterized protein YndB with AHSA1/START domain
MNADASEAVSYDDGVLVITRHYDAPRELVFRMWTEAEHFARWFGPASGSVPHCTVKPSPAQPGSELHFCVVVPPGESGFGGETVWGKWIFRELITPERMAFDDYFSDEQGNIVERPGFAQETAISVVFDEHEGGTKMTLRHELKVDQGEIDGWNVGFDRMKGYLQSLQRG